MWWRVGARVLFFLESPVLYQKVFSVRLVTFWEEKSFPFLPAGWEQARAGVVGLPLWGDLWEPDWRRELMASLFVCHLWLTAPVWSEASRFLPHSLSWCVWFWTLSGSVQPELNLLFSSEVRDEYCLIVWGQRGDLRGLTSGSDFQPILLFSFPCLTLVCSGSWTFNHWPLGGFAVLTGQLFGFSLCSLRLQLSFPCWVSYCLSSCYPSSKILLASLIFLFFPLSLCPFIHLLFPQSQS